MSTRPNLTPEDCELLDIVDRQLEELDGISEAFSATFGGSPGGFGRTEAIERAWNAVDEAIVDLHRRRAEFLASRP